MTTESGEGGLSGCELSGVLDRIDKIDRIIRIWECACSQVITSSRSHVIGCASFFRI